MGAGFSHVFPCLNPLNDRPAAKERRESELVFAESEPLDETLGHSFCYVRSSANFLSPDPSDRFLSPGHSLRFSPPREPAAGGVKPRGGGGGTETGFRSISGASVSANTTTPKTVLQLDGIYDDATDYTGFGKSSIVNGFESSASFSSLPLQPVPRNGDQSGPVERGFFMSGPVERGFFMSGPVERGFFMSGPIERGALSGPLDANTARSEGGRVHFSAPLGLSGPYVKRRKRRSISGIRKAFNRNLSDKKKPWVVPVLNFVGRKETQSAVDGGGLEGKNEIDNDVQWALGKAGEDRVHVVVSEEHGWLFVGIYDGFNGPDAPEFLMGNLYRAVFKELEGLFWDVEAIPTISDDTSNVAMPSVVNTDQEDLDRIVLSSQEPLDKETVKKVTFQEGEIETRRRKLFEFLAEDDLEEGLDLSGSQRFAFSVDDALGVNKAGSAVSRRSLLLSKLKHGLSKNKEGRSRNLIPWKFTLDTKVKDGTENENRVEESLPIIQRRKVGPIDHESVLRALSRALELTELRYLDMTDKFLDRNPELALMGSCLLAVLMRDEDVFVMNVGDSRAIVAQYEPLEVSSSTESKMHGDNGSSGENIVEDSAATGEGASMVVKQAPVQAMRLAALQLSTDHSTSIEEEVIRIKNEHPDDSQCFVNDRVKGRLKVTRAFGAGFLKQPKWNDVLLEMFRNEYIGTAPYISCTPSLRHHKLCTRDQFLILSSDGLYQYFSNQEAVSEVETFMENFPDGDPAQHLIEELLFRAAKKAGMDFHELLDIPQGDRRKYHDDVTVMVVSLEGRIWKSSGKYL